MAWKTFLKNYSAGQQATVFADYCAFAVTAGWTLHDDVSASRKVFRSNGESGTEIMEYLQVDYDATALQFRLFTYWDAAAHVGYGQAYYHSTMNCHLTANTAGVKRFYGNKDVLLAYVLDTSNYMALYGFLCTNRFCDEPLATLSGSVSAGASVVCAVDDTEGFPLNSKAIIVDPSTGSRQSVTINAINPGVSLTLQTLAHGYAAGSKIGWEPVVFGTYGSGYVNIATTVTGGCSGTVQNSAYSCAVPSALETGYNPSGVSGLRALNHVYVNSIVDTIAIGLMPSQVRCNASCARNVIFAVNDTNQFDILTATGGAANSISDATKTWTVDEHKGKSVAIVGGTGIDQSRVILSNTATTITVRDNWGTSPVAGTNFIIADRTYLCVMANFMCILENEE